MKKFSIHPISIIIWLWLVIMLGFVSGLGYLLAVVLHETGHFFEAKHLGYKLSKFSISPYGFSLSYFGQDIEREDEIKIAFAGPLINFVTALLVVGLWWICPVSYYFTESFVTASFVLGLFNLLPAYPLDGGRIFVCFGNRFFGEKISKNITKVFNILLAIFFFILFVVCLFINFNPTYLLYSCFLFVGVIDLNFGSKYEKINVFCKPMKNFSKPCIWCVNEMVSIAELLKKMQTKKINIFYVILNNGKIVKISERMILKFALNFSYDTKLEKIIKNI